MNNNGFKENFNPDKINYEKSVMELSKFFSDNLEKYFLAQKTEFTADEEDEKAKVERFRDRLEELLAKATKRLGHKIDEAKLVNDASEHLLSLKNSGELVSSNLLEKFCSEVENRLKNVA